MTDYKPLLAVFGSKKGIPVHSANRLQRWALTLLGYEFDIEYQRTEDFGQADALSRLIANHTVPEEDVVIVAVSVEQSALRQLSDSIRGLPVTAADVKKATRQDQTLQTVLQYCQSRWPSKVSEYDLRQFFVRRGSLSIVDECLMFGDRVVVPTALRQRVLRQFHTGHPGIGRMKAIARSFAYWPGMDTQIENCVKQCSHCQQAAKHPPRLPPIPWPKPESPWSRVHVDFAGPIDGVVYMVLVDAYSKWPEIEPVTPPTSAATIKVLSRIFSQHGIPETLVSDNGSQFTSGPFNDFCRRNGVEHIYSPPYHPQSNGQAERFVDTFKRALLKARGEGNPVEIIHQFLLIYRTPNRNTPENKSPAEALTGRKLRTTLNLMIPTSKPRRQQLSTDNTSKLPVNTTVYTRDYRSGRDAWIEGTISERHGEVMYDVSIEGDLWTRHRNQIRPRQPSVMDTDPVTTNLPLDILLDTFEIQPSGTTPTAVTSTRRTSRRQRKRTQPFLMDPRLKRYCFLNRGGVGRRHDMTMHHTALRLRRPPIGVD